MNDLGQTYYTYFVLDPRTECFEKGGFSLPHVPIYVGKGKGRRFKDLTCKNRWLKNTISKIKSIGCDPIYLKFFHDSEQEAFISEEAFIETFGMRANDTGPLLNLCPGGKGGFGLNNTGKKSATLGTKMYNNGIKQGRFFPEQKPEGWSLGRLDKPWNTGLTAITHPQLANGGSKKGHKKKKRNTL